MLAVAFFVVLVDCCEVFLVPKARAKIPTHVHKYADPVAALKFAARKFRLGNLTHFFQSINQTKVQKLPSKVKRFPLFFALP